MAAPVTSLDAVTAPGAGRVGDLRTPKHRHTMFVRVTGRPSYFEVYLSVSHDGEVWYDAGSVGGAYPADRDVFEVGYQGVVRYVRAHLTQLTAQFETTVTATIASC